MDPASGRATIAGIVGTFVAEGQAGEVWEVRVSPERLAQLLAQCSAGRALEVSTAGGSYRALARRWWVLSAGAELLVRITLEKSAAA